MLDFSLSMQRGLLIVLFVMPALAGCPSGAGQLGDKCDGTSDCGGGLQCLAHACVPHCQRAPDCGDGYACDGNGLCQLASGQPGDACTSEVQCSPGLSCQIDGTAVDANNRLEASCLAATGDRPAGSPCATDADCRNGTCALGLCVDLCATTSDCIDGESCVLIPRVDPAATDPSKQGSLFSGCLPAHGSLAWTIPVTSAAQSILVPIPSVARSLTMTLGVDDLNQKVGVTSVISPLRSDGSACIPDPVSDPLCVLYRQPCDPAHITGCDPEEDYFRNLVRHAPDFGQSTLAMPSNPDLPLQPVAYQVDVASLRPDNSPGSAVPHVTAVIKLDVSAILDLHFHFLDLTDHPCNDSFGALVSDIPNDRLTAASAQAAGPFQAEFLKGRDALKDIFVAAGIAFGTLTYDDILDHPDLDGLDIADTGSLFALSTYPIGINIYFVRTVSPIGLQAFGPNPGPAGLAGTRQSGIVIGVDTLCYRSWTQLARLTAHEIARYMGLYHNVEAESGAHPNWIDPIADDDADNANNNNLMFFSDAPPLVVGGQGPGIHLSPQQSDILTRSAVLR